jgi:16S rRNA (adenine1518-N6/adenine1519-N6)-dimethyltransferase
MRPARAPGAPGRPRKRFGQHFLEPVWVTRLVELIRAVPGETIVEIGPGRGAITRPLAASGAMLRVVEVDRDLAAALRADLPRTVTIVEADFLELDADRLFGEAARVRVVGNLPYNLSTPILFRLLELARRTGRITEAIVMLQREVADRVLAGPGSGDYGPLAIGLGLFTDRTRLLSLPPGAFRPPPKVHSAVVRLVFRPPAQLPRSEARFDEVVRSIFQQRRKTVANALRPVSTRAGFDAQRALLATGIDPARRPETLSLAELVALSDATASNIEPDP